MIAQAILSQKVQTEFLDSEVWIQMEGLGDG